MFVVCCATNDTDNVNGVSVYKFVGSYAGKLRVIRNALQVLWVRSRLCLLSLLCRMSPAASTHLFADVTLASCIGYELSLSVLSASVITGNNVTKTSENMSL